MKYEDRQFNPALHRRSVEVNTTLHFLVAFSHDKMAAPVRGMLSLFRRSDENRWWIRKKAAKKRCYTHRLKRKKHQRLAIACEICGRAEKELFPKVAWMVIIGAVIQTSRLMEKHDDKTEDFRCFQPAYQVPVANGQLRASLLPKRLKYFFFFFLSKRAHCLKCCGSFFSSLTVKGKKNPSRSVTRCPSRRAVCSESEPAAELTQSV